MEAKLLWPGILVCISQLWSRKSLCCHLIVNCVGLPTMAPETSQHDALSGVHTTVDDVGNGNSRDQRCLGSALALCVTSYTSGVVLNLAATTGAIPVSTVLVSSPPPSSRPEAVVK